jgi:hypothetical protein
MTAKMKLHGYLRSKKGDSAVEFIMTAAMLVLVFAMLISAMIYVTQYYSASYICRRVVRTIETTGEYDEATVLALADDLGGDALDDLNIQVDATYCSGTLIQLRTISGFTVRLSTELPLCSSASTDLCGHSNSYPALRAFGGVLEMKQLRKRPDSSVSIMFSVF